MDCNNLPTHSGVGPVTRDVAIARSRDEVTCKVLGRDRAYSRPPNVFPDTGSEKLGGLSHALSCRHYY